MREICVYMYIYIYTWIYQSFYLVINRPGIYHQHFIVGRQPNIPGGEGMGRSWFGLRGGWSQLHCQSRRWSWWSWGTSCVFGKNNNGILGIVWWIGEYIYIYIYIHVHIHTHTLHTYTWVHRYIYTDNHIYSVCLSKAIYDWQWSWTHILWKHSDKHVNKKECPWNFSRVPRSHGTFIPTFASHTREGVSDGSMGISRNLGFLVPPPQIIPGEERRRKLAEREARAWGTQSGSELQ